MYTQRGERRNKKTAARGAAAVPLSHWPKKARVCSPGGDVLRPTVGRRPALQPEHGWPHGHGSSLVTCHGSTSVTIPSLPRDSSLPFYPSQVTLKPAKAARFSTGRFRSP